MHVHTVSVCMSFRKPNWVGKKATEFQLPHQSAFNHPALIPYRCETKTAGSVVMGIRVFVFVGFLQCDHFGHPPTLGKLIFVQNDCCLKMTENQEGRLKSSNPLGLFGTFARLNSVGKAVLATGHGRRLTARIDSSGRPIGGRVGGWPAGLGGRYSPRSAGGTGVQGTVQQPILWQGQCSTQKLICDLKSTEQITRNVQCYVQWGEEAVSLVCARGGTVYRMSRYLETIMNYFIGLWAVLLQWKWYIVQESEDMPHSLWVSHVFGSRALAWGIGRPLGLHPSVLADK